MAPLVSLEDIKFQLEEHGLATVYAEAITDWINNGWWPGSPFLQALIRNDLLNAYRAGGYDDITRLGDWAEFLYKFFPAQSLSGPAYWRYIRGNGDA